MKLLINCIFPGLLLIFVAGCSTDFNSVKDDSFTINLGDQASEQAHNVSAEDADMVGKKYPERWIMAMRASAYEKGYEPYRVIDNDPDTHWQVTGQPPQPMQGGQWVVLDLNQTSEIEEVSVRWLGEEPYEFKVYEHPWSDATDTHVIYEGKSEGQAEELETYNFSEAVKTRSIRIQFTVDEGEGPRGIQEVRIGGLSWPESYPLAAYNGAPVVEIKRPYYVEFQRMLEWPQFNLKRPLADGGSARRILSTHEFEGGHIDFDIGVDPQEQNWITLKIWESHPELMTERGDAIALEAFAEHPDQNRRWFLPKFMNEEKVWERVWYGLKPQPGRWVYASYKLDQDITGGKNQVHLRLQGIGNDQRDHPMRSPAPPVYRINSHTEPFF